MIIIYTVEKYNAGLRVILADPTLRTEKTRIIMKPRIEIRPRTVYDCDDAQVSMR